MGIKIRHIATRFALILTIAAILPLVAYGVVSILSLRNGTRESIIAGNLNVATRAADEIRRYVSGHTDILKALNERLRSSRDQEILTAAAEQSKITRLRLEKILTQ